MLIPVLLLLTVGMGLTLIAVSRRAGQPLALLIALAVAVAVGVALYWGVPSLIVGPHPALDWPTCRHIWLVPRVLFGAGAGVATASVVFGVIAALRARQLHWFFPSLLPAVPCAFIAEVGRQLLVHVGDAAGC